MALHEAKGQVQVSEFRVETIGTGDPEIAGGGPSYLPRAVQESHEAVESVDR